MSADERLLERIQAQVESAVPTGASFSRAVAAGLLAHTLTDWLRANSDVLTPHRVAALSAALEPLANKEVRR